MRGRKPAVRCWSSRLSANTLAVALSLLCCVIPVCTALIAGWGATIAWAQAKTARVTGADRVFVRRGPGKEFPPFATLTKGTALEVQALEGEWARVVTPSGQVGYMSSTFLALPDELENPPPAAAEAPHPSAPQPTAARPESAAVRPESAAVQEALTERNRTLEADVRRLQDELTAIKNRPEPTAAPLPTIASGGGAEQLRAELARLAAAIDGLQRRLDARSTSEPAAPISGNPLEGAPHLVSPTALLLGAIGLLLGWLVGTAHGRNQERGRRSRIRF